MQTPANRHRVFRMIFGICVICAVHVPVGAVQPYEPNKVDPLLEPWRWTHIEALDGLSFQCMAQEPNETMWFGLKDGVMRYDSLQWQRFSLDDGLTPWVKCILVTPDGCIYVQSAEAIHLYQDHQWITVLAQSYSGSPGQSMTADDQGGVWAACDQGLVYIENGTARLVANVEGPVTTVFVDSRKQLWYLCDDFREAYVASLAQTHAGSLGGIQSIPLLHRDRSRQGCILESTDGRIWIASDGSGDPVHIFDPSLKTWSQINLSTTLGRYACTAMAQTQDHTVWLVGQGRLYARRQGMQRTYDAPDLEIPSSPPVLLTGIDGSLWLGGKNAKVFRIDYSDQRYTTYQDLHFQCESPPGTCWFLEKTGAIVKYETKDKRWLRYGIEDGLPDAPVVMAAAGDGSIWAAGSHQGQAAVAYYDEQQWHLRLFPHLGFGISPYSVLESTSGDMLFGSALPRDWGPTLGAGLLRFFRTDQGYQSEHLASPLVPFRIVGIAQTKEGLWFGGPYLARFDGYHTQRIQTPLSLATDWIDHLTCAPDGDLWVAKGGDGVFRYDGNTWKQYTMEDGLASNMVTYTMSHPDGTLWAATDAGISCFDGDQWQSLACPASFRLNRESGSLGVSEDGAVWVNYATRDWYFRALDPNLADVVLDDHPYLTTRYRPDKMPPDTEIDFSLEQIQPASPIRISWTGRDAWSVTPKGQLLYSFRMDQGAWSAFAPEAMYTWYNLPSGRHTVEVQARDRDRNIDPTPAQVSFTVLRPTWRQPWFLLLLGSLLLAIVVLIVRLVKAHEVHITQQLQFEKEKAQQQLKIDESRLAFFTNISHELRTPLTLITGPLESMLTKLKDSDLREQLLLIKRNADRLLQLASQLLDIHKLETGRLELHLTINDLVGFVNGIVASLQPTTTEKRLTLSHETTLSELTVAFDADKLEKVLTNLISNAIKFTDPGGTITVKTQQFDRQIQLTVEDSGIGIPPNELDHIFERFYRIDKHGQTAGSGIGLSLAQELIGCHQGTIQVISPIAPESSERPGTRFIVTIPMRDPETVETADLSTDQAEEDFETDTLPTVLIVEDNDDMRQYVGSILTQEYRLLEAVNGQQGLQLAQENTPDLIISDIMMPEMDGIKLCRALRKDEKTSHIPIILLTAKGSEAAQVEGLETGADDYVMKPFSQVVLKARLANLLESRQRLQAHFQRNPFIPLQKITSNPVDERFLKRALDVVEEHLADYDFAMDAFSSQMHMSRSTLYRKIKALTGQTPSVFIRTVRLKHAAELLKTGHYNISEVAYQVGFLDMAYFSNCFKKQFHCNPSQFKSQHKTSNG
ncbi:MAG: response regulator [Phycisphaerales bacterium]|nr:MAG: response regulator [Phycisphaerales bacterium]